MTAYALVVFLNSYNIARNDNSGEDGCLTFREDYEYFITYFVISAFPFKERVSDGSRAWKGNEGGRQDRAVRKAGHINQDSL